MTNSLFKKSYKRILNGIAIGYNLHDLHNYFEFLFKWKNDSDILKTIDLNKFNFKIIVISLSFRKDRREFITNQFAELNIPFEFFNAFHGETEKTRFQHVVQFSENSIKYLSPGSIGCIASNIAIWKELSTSHFDAFLIFEDDVVLNITFSKLAKIISTVPDDFDLLYLGSGSYKKRLNAKSISNSLFVPFSIRKGAFGYLISKNGVDKILQNVTEINITCGGIDTILGVLTMKRKIKSYHVKPSACEVNFSLPSNIFNSSKPSKILHKTEII